MHLSTMCNQVEKVSANQKPGGGHLVFPIDPNNTNLVEDFEILLPVFVEFRSVVSEKKSKMTQPIRKQGGLSCFFDRHEKHKLGRGS